MGRETTELTLDVVGGTDDAMLLTDGTYQEWVARSLMENDPGPTAAGENVTVEIPVWLAKKAGWV